MSEEIKKSDQKAPVQKIKFDTNNPVLDKVAERIVNRRDVVKEEVAKNYSENDSIGKKFLDGLKGAHKGLWGPKEEKK